MGGRAIGKRVGRGSPPASRSGRIDLAELAKGIPYGLEHRRALGVAELLAPGAVDGTAREDAAVAAAQRWLDAYIGSFPVRVPGWPVLAAGAARARRGGRSARG